MACVYWLFDGDCTDPWRHGYVGVTTELRLRLKWHRQNRKQPFEHKILFSGTEAECYALEAKMRPAEYIGWNIAFGGVRANRHKRSPETRQRLRDAALRRYTDPAQRAAMSAVQMGRKVTWGDKIAESKRGMKLSAETRAKMSAVRKGRPAPPRTAEHRANISASRIGMKMPWIAESNRRRAKTKEAAPCLSV